MHTPRLRKLWMQSFYVPFNASTLTSLYLNRTSEHALPPPAQFLCMLHSCTKLQNLSLLNWIPADLGPALEPTISLPTLYFLNVADRFNRCIALGSYITLPPFTSRNFSFTHIGTAEARTASYFDLMEPYFKCAFSLPVASLVCRHPGPHTAFFNLKTTSGVLRQHSQSVQPISHTFVFTVADSESRLSFRRIFYRFAKTLDLTRTRQLTLQLGRIHPYPVNVWRDLLVPLSRIETLYLQDYASVWLMPVLAPTGNEAAPMLPQLRFLWIQSLDLYGKDSGDVRNAMTRKDLLFHFIERKRTGYPLERLRIDKLIVDKDEAIKTLLPRLRAIIPVVECGLDNSLGPVTEQ
ncbi:hypothetical protein K488DRAFT_81990 [Vararia minispora EC-137]|uniref:Uncharacterized protein n=1 Tax=Vararia minispora EC-137 TaxID=1314806 RepID=A0ACB8QXV0_9AGAM|nr:hypothetical protein K488DRAFT_81990 [Vararia minispora EC-137]